MDFRYLVLASFAFFMTGCSDENKEIRGNFLAGCVQGGASKSLCSCSFEKIEQKYTPAELKQINSRSTPPESFIKDVMQSALACRNE